MNRSTHRNTGDTVLFQCAGLRSGSGAHAAFAKCRSFADDIGATLHTVVGDDVPTALLKFARGVNATQLVLGTPRRSRLAQVFDEGIGAAVLQASGPIDMHMVTHHEARRGVWWRIGRNPVIGALTRSHRIAGWALALVLPAACAAVGVVLRERIELSTALAMVIVALQAKGRGRAMPSPVLGASPDALHDLVTEAFPTWRCGR